MSCLQTVMEILALFLPLRCMIRLGLAVVFQHQIFELINFYYFLSDYTISSSPPSTSMILFTNQYMP